MKQVKTIKTYFFKNKTYFKKYSQIGPMHKLTLIGLYLLGIIQKSL